jgi:hypothetical protein
MCSRKQAGHQQPVSTPGTGTTGGNRVHQHGASSPSAMAQPNDAPQRVQLLIGVPGGGRVRGPGKSLDDNSYGLNRKIQQDRNIMRTAFGLFAVKSRKILFRTFHERSADQSSDRRPEQ